MATREILQSFKKIKKSNFIMKKNILQYKENNKKVKELCILVDLHNKNLKSFGEQNLNPLMIKFGDYETINNYYTNNFKESPLFNMKVIKIPNKLYKWIDAISFLRNQDWVTLLLIELKYIK